MINPNNPTDGICYKCGKTILECTTSQPCPQCETKKLYFEPDINNNLEVHCFECKSKFTGRIKENRLELMYNGTLEILDM